MREKRLQREQEELRIQADPSFKKEFGNLQHKLKKDLKGIFGSEQDVQHHHVLSDAAQKNTDPSLLPSLLSSASKGDKSTSKHLGGVPSAASNTLKNTKVAQLVPRFLLQDVHGGQHQNGGDRRGSKIVSQRFDNETLSKQRLAMQKNAKHFSSRHTRNSIDVNTGMQTEGASMIPKDHQLRASGSHAIHQMYSTQQDHQALTQRP